MATWTIAESGYPDYEGSGVVDVIDFNTSGLAMADIASSDVSPRLTLRGSAHDDNLHINLTGNASFSAQRFTFGAGWSSAVDHLQFNDSTGNNIITGSSGPDRFFLRGGADSINGGAGQDVLSLYQPGASQSFSTSAGHIQGTGGASVRYSGIERLELILGSGNDRVVGLAGDDDMSGGGGQDTLDGAGGNDDLFGSRGNDLLKGGLGHDTLDGGLGSDRLEGGSGHDTLMGGILGSNDDLYGGAGNDKLYATTDRVSSSGSSVAAQVDRFVGGLGEDHLYGGQDELGDDFVFETKADSAVGANRDHIYDFTTGSDDIDLSAIDARASTSSNDSFSYSGQTAAAHSAWWKVVGADVVVRADVNGDATADMEIRLTGTSSLSINDFVL